MCVRVVFRLRIQDKSKRAYTRYYNAYIFISKLGRHFIDVKKLQGIIITCIIMPSMACNNIWKVVNRMGLTCMVLRCLGT